MSLKKENKVESTEPTQEQVKTEPVQENVEKQQDPLMEMTDLLKRTQANFENYRKQTEKRVEDIRLMASRNIISQLLPVIDNFELAIKSGSNNVQNNELVKGIELIYSQFFTILEDNGVKAIESEGKKFDPYLHEALIKVESMLPENVVVEELQKGFTLNNVVIRHAKVKLSSGKKLEVKEENKNENNNQGGQ